MSKKSLKILLLSFVLVGIFSLVVVLGVKADDEGTVTATVTVQNISVSVDDGGVTYGTMASNTSKTTLSGELNDMQTATNDGNVTEDFNIKGKDSDDWELADTTASDQYVHQFCNETDDDCSTPPTSYTAMNEDDYTTLDEDIVATTGTTDFHLRITTPNPSTVYTQQSVDVTVQAVAAS